MIVIGRDDGADLARFRQGRRFRAQFAEVRGAPRLADPVRHRAGEVRNAAVDQLVLRKVRLVVGGIHADDVDDGGIGPGGVVQHGDAVGEAAGDVQEGESRRSFMRP